MVLGKQFRPLASKLCSHRAKPYIDCWLTTVGATGVALDLARDAGDAIYGGHAFSTIESPHSVNSAALG